MPFRIAVVQFKIAHLDPEKNFRRIEDFIRKAKQQRADVVVFPEDCITGSIFGDLSKLDRGEVLPRFQKLAKAYGIDIVTGSCMRETPQGNYNTGFYVDAKGKVLAAYDKTHLYPSEVRFLKPGNGAHVFKTRHGKAAIVICWDMLFPGLFADLKKQGVEIIYCPSYWYQEIAQGIPGHHPQSESRLLDALCLARSVEANAAMVYANAAGSQTYPNGEKDTLIGHSQIVLPGTDVLKRLQHSREGIFVQEVDLHILKHVKKVYHG